MLTSSLPKKLQIEQWADLARAADLCKIIIAVAALLCNQVPLITFVYNGVEDTAASLPDVSSSNGTKSNTVAVEQKCISDVNASYKNIMQSQATHGHKAKAQARQYIIIIIAASHQIHLHHPKLQ